MTDPFVISRLQHLTTFNSLPPALLSQISDLVSIHQVPAGQYLFRQGETSQGFFLLVDGHGLFTQIGADGVERQVGELWPNQYIGEDALRTQRPENFSLYINAPSRVMFLSRQHFTQAITGQAPQQHPTQQPAQPQAQEIASPLKAITAPAFKGQRAGEKILLYQRRHPWILAQQSLLPVIIGTLLIVAAVVVGMSGNSSISLVMMALALIIPALWIGYLYMEWSDDSVIITDQRIISIHNYLLTFRSNISEIPIANVHEVNAIIPEGDPMARLLNYGTVQIKTAGTSGNLELNYIGNPEVMQKIIFDDKEQYQKGQQSEMRDQIRTDIQQTMLMQNPAAGAVRSQAALTPLEEENDADESAIESGTEQIPGWLTTRYVNADGEIIYRKHASIWLSHIAFPSLIILVGVIIMAGSIFTGGILTAAVGIIEALLGFVVIIIGGIWFYWADWDWRNDLYILGHQRISLIHRRPLWMQNINDQVLLSQVDNVVSDRNGLINTLLNRGDVRISLIGDDKAQGKVFAKVANPDDVQVEVSARREESKRALLDNERRKQHEVIAEYLEVYQQQLATQNPQAQTPFANQSANQGFAPAPQQPQQAQSPYQPNPSGYQTPITPNYPPQQTQTGFTQHPVNPQTGYQSPPPQQPTQTPPPKPPLPNIRGGSRPPGIPRSRNNDRT